MDKRDHPELWHNNSDSMNTKKARQKARATYVEGLELGRIVHAWFGKHHTEESKRKISRHHIETGSHRGEKNAMYGKKHSEISKERMSETRTKKWVEGKYQTYGKNNHDTGDRHSIKMNKTMHYRSSWEKACMQYFDTADDVVSFEYEKMRIPYYDSDHHKRHYIPDFLVTFRDGHKEMWEIKPRQFVNSTASKAKSASAEEWCSQNGVVYQILTKDDLVQKGII
jgi:hypothetical protein